jgi:hypothetical protein
MPKLIIKQNLPPLSVEDKLLNALQLILPIVLLLVAVSAAVSLYFSNHNEASPVVMPSSSDMHKPVVVTVPVAPEVVPVEPAPQMAAPPVEDNAPAKPDAAADTGLPAGVTLPPGMCPLFGPGAAECKAGAKH